MEGWGVKLGEMGVRDCVSMNLYGEEERSSLTYFPGPSPCKMCMKIVYNSSNKQSDGPLEEPTVVRTARKEDME
jgi:hypothetical protein